MGLKADESGILQENQDKMKTNPTDKKKTRKSRFLAPDTAKTAVCIGIGLLLLGLSAIRAQGPDSARIHLAGRAYRDHVRLRWAASTPRLWRKTLESGWTLERYDFDTVMMSEATRKNLPYVPARKIVGISPFLQTDTARWAAMADTDTYAAVLGEAVFNPGFSLSLGGTALSSWNRLAKDMEREQVRFVLANTAYDRSFAVACAGKTGYVDNDVESGHFYLYRLYANFSDSTDGHDTALYFTRMEPGTLIPPVQEIRTDFGYLTVNLEWDYRLCENHCTGYYVERSTQKAGSGRRKPTEHVRLNQTPLGILQENVSKKMHFRDSLPDGEDRYAYRVIGVDLFGHEFPVARSRYGKSTGVPLATAVMDSISRTKEKVFLHWSYPEENMASVKGFSIYVSTSPEPGEDERTLLLGSLSPATRRHVLDLGRLGVSSYFHVETKGTDGKSTLSRPFFYWKKDSIPPSPPQGLSCTVDSAGIVRLHWKPSADADVSGYRVFRQTHKTAEPVQVTSRSLEDTVFYDTLSLNTRQYSYYSVRATDASGNLSAPSRLLAVKNLLPDKPAPAVFSRKSHLDDDKVELTWYNSSSSNVRGHLLLCRSDSSKWFAVKDFPLKENEKAPESTSFTFTLPERQHVTRYSFNIVAYGSDKQADTSNTPFAYQTMYIPRLKPGMPFAVTDAENRYVQLQWKNRHGKPIRHVFVYRRPENGKLRLLATLDSEKAEDESYTDFSVKMNTEYAYVVQFEYEDGTWSAYSEPCNVEY